MRALHKPQKVCYIKCKTEINKEKKNEKKKEKKMNNSRQGR